MANEEITRGRRRVKGKKNNMEMFEYSTMRRAIEFLCLLCELFLYSIDVSLCLIWEILLFCYYKNVFVNFKRFLFCLFFYLANECIHKYQKMSEERAFIMWCENNVFLNLHSCSLVHSFNQNKSTVGCSQTILILLIPSFLDNVFGEIDCECNRKEGDEEERDNSGFVSLEDRTKEREILCLIYPRLEAIVIGSCSLLKLCFEKEKEVDKILMLIMQKRELTNSRCCWGNMDVDVIEN